MDTPIVFLRPGSPWSSKVSAYLSLRRISYAACYQPVTMPRPDLAALGVAYRRVPLLSFGRDIYCDTVLILSVLETLFPPSERHPTITPATPEARSLAYLLEKWTDLAVFPKFVDCFPISHPIFQDPKLVQDRSEVLGYEWNKTVQKERRPSSLVAMRGFFEFIENDLLADGRHWVLNTDRPMLADLQAAWVFENLTSLDGALDPESISEDIYPRTYGWCRRYRQTIDRAAEKTNIEEIDGTEALRRILSAPEVGELDVDETDPLGLKSGQTVEVAPVDTGTTGVQKGKLLGLEKDQVILEARTENEEVVRVRFPRWSFKITPA